MTATPDTARAWRVLRLAQAHPDALDMDQWASEEAPVALGDLSGPDRCGTTACYAGWTLAEAGYATDRHGRVYENTPRGWSVIPRPDGHMDNHVESFAATLLGISGGQASNLFFVEDDELEDVVRHYFGPEPAPVPAMTGEKTHA